MKCSIQTFIFVSFLLFLHCSKNYKDDKRQKALGESEIEITYVNNEGFIITSKEKKIIIDGLHNFDISKEDQIKMVKAQPPFNNIDLVLATHDHADHFDANTVGGHLLNNENATFISTRQALEELQTEFNGFDRISDRVISIYPKENEILPKSIKEIELEVINLRHGLNSPTQNLGFHIRIANKQILHIGDAQHINIDDLKANGIYDKKIDIAFIPYWYLIYKDDRKVFQDIIHNSKVIAMHLGWVEEGLETVMHRIEIEYPEAIVFKKFLETKIFK